MSMPRRRESEPRGAAVEVGARVTARRVRFKNKPEVKVEFRGGSRNRTASGTERKNIPDEVEPGVTYRDVEVNWLAAAQIVEADERVTNPDEDEEHGGHG